MLLKYLHVILLQATLKTCVIEAQHALTVVELELKQTQELEEEFEAEVAQSSLESKLTQVSIIWHVCLTLPAIFLPKKGKFFWKSGFKSGSEKKKRCFYNPRDRGRKRVPRAGVGPDVDPLPVPAAEIFPAWKSHFSRRKNIF